MDEHRHNQMELLTAEQVERIYRVTDDLGLSRDWVVDKLSVNVDYGTDIDKVKKLIKQIGKALAQDAELAPLILGPLKLQGIEQFSDYGIQLRMKLTARPGASVPCSLVFGSGC